jgi:alpha-D-ribose 1-methylphosphonate 5-triphosphate synthase subunit PhnL
MTPLLLVEGLEKRFLLHNQGGVEVQALAGLDLRLMRGECVALTGPSGAGKSTVLRCVYGNYAASAGRILVRHGSETIDVATAHPRTILALRRRTLGYVSQFLRVVPRVPALDVVAEPAVAAGASVEEARERAAYLLDRLALPHRLWQLSPLTFSGGEQQRVNIARGFAFAYPILLLDEPTSALDADNRRRVGGLIEEATGQGAAVLGIFHDAEFVRQVATRAIALSPPLRRAA